MVNGPDEVNSSGGLVKNQWLNGLQVWEKGNTLTFLPGAFLLPNSLGDANHLSKFIMVLY